MLIIGPAIEENLKQWYAENIVDACVDDSFA